MNEHKGIIIITLLVIFFIGGMMAVMPKYRIYSQDLRGQASLREAEWTKKILIEDAKARTEAATLQAEAEVEVNQQMRADSLTDIELTQRSRELQIEAQLQAIKDKLEKE